jgi:hypothetical protein
LAIGLFFFIRASTKDRTEVVQLISDEPEASLLEQLQTYFTQRSYRLVAVDAVQNRVTYEGIVRPSTFLAIFLTLLAAVGTLCLSLVLAILFPTGALVFPALLLIAPIAGLFYWKKAERVERVLLSIQTVTDAAVSKKLLTVTAHRDELIELQRTLPFQAVE